MTQPVAEPSDSRSISGVDYRTRQLARRPALQPPTGNAIYAIEVFEADIEVLAGDNRFEWAIPEHLDEAVLVAIEGYLVTASSSGAVQVQIANERYAGGTVDMLSTVLSIDPGELNSDDAGTPVVIDTGNAEVLHKDHLRVDVDNPGSGATGLGLILTFIPNTVYQFAITGQQGPPGGVTNWTGPWADATGYLEGDVVHHNGITYVAIQDHTSEADNEPGVGVDWEDFWMVLIEGNTQSAITITMNGNGYVLDTGIKGWVEVPFDCTVDEVVMLSDLVGSAVVDIWKDSYANFPPTDADSITGASPPTITAARKSIDSVLSGWSPSLVAGDILAFNVDSCSTITLLTISLKVLR